MTPLAKRLRIDRGLTLMEVCEQAKVTYPTLKRIEEGLEGSAPTLKKLGDFYGVEPSSLLPQREAA